MPSDENNENNEIIIQKGGEGMGPGAQIGIGPGAQIGIGVGIVAIIVGIGVGRYLYNFDYLKKLQKVCVEMIKKDLKMQMRVCLAYELKISKMKNGGLFGNKKPEYHKFSKIFILNKLKNNYFFGKLTGVWNSGVSFKEIFKDTTVQKMLQKDNFKLKKEDIVEYIVFDIFFCSINDVIIDEILNDFKENGLEDAKPKTKEAYTPEISSEKMKQLNQKIKSRALRRIGLRIKSLNIKKYDTLNIKKDDEIEEGKDIENVNTLKILCDEMDNFFVDKKYKKIKKTLKEFAEGDSSMKLNKWLEGKEGEPIKTGFDIQDKICEQLKKVSEKVEKMEIDKIMANFSNDGADGDGADGAVRFLLPAELLEKQKNMYKNMYNNIFSSCLGGKKKQRKQAKQTLIDICKKFPRIFGPINTGFSVVKTFSKNKNLYKTHETTTKTKRLLCNEIIEALIEDVLTPLQNAIVKKFKKQTEPCEEQLNAPLKPEGKYENIEETVKKGGAIVGQGTFGCVFRPHIKCSKKKFKKEHVSKLVVDREWRIHREIKLSEKIKSIPNYQHFFAPIEEICDTNLSKISKEDKKGCKLLYKNNDKYVKKIANIRFIDGHDVVETLTKNGNQKDYFIYFLTMYEQLLDCVQLLNDKKIIHHDIKFNNIIYDKKKNRTIILDFGLSFDLENIIHLKRCFYIDWAPDWTLWPVEVHYLGFVINNRKKMTSEEINSFATEYLDEHRVFINLKYIVPDVLIQKYKKKTIKILNFYNNKNIDSVVSYIINSYWETWNSYSLNIMFYRLLNVINMSGYSNNVFFQELVKIFNDNISPIPTERNSIAVTKEKFKNVKKLLSPEIYNKFFKNMKNNKLNIMKTLKNDKSTWKRKF